MAGRGVWKPSTWARIRALRGDATAGVRCANTKKALGPSREPCRGGRA